MEVYFKQVSKAPCPFSLGKQPHRPIHTLSARTPLAKDV